jgi:hypothetical protein
LEDSKTRLRSQLDEIKRKIDAIPELRREFERHALYLDTIGAVPFSARRPAVMPDSPTELYLSVTPDEEILHFLHRVWRPYLYFGFANLDDLKAKDPRAFNAVPWPTIKYKESPEYPGNVTGFLRQHWKALIEIGIATRVVVRQHDKPLDAAIATWLHSKGPLPADIWPATKAEVNDRALQATAIPHKHLPRVVVAYSRRVRRELGLD